MSYIYWSVLAINFFWSHCLPLFCPFLFPGPFFSGGKLWWFPMPKAALIHTADTVAFLQHFSPPHQLPTSFQIISTPQQSVQGWYQSASPVYLPLNLSCTNPTHETPWLSSFFFQMNFRYFVALECFLSYVSISKVPFCPTLDQVWPYFHQSQIKCNFLYVIFPSSPLRNLPTALIVLMTSHFVLCNNFEWILNHKQFQGSSFYSLCLYSLVFIASTLCLVLCDIHSRSVELNFRIIQSWFTDVVKVLTNQHPLRAFLWPFISQICNEGATIVRNRPGWRMSMAYQPPLTKTLTNLKENFHSIWHFIWKLLNLTSFDVYFTPR